MIVYRLHWLSLYGGFALNPLVILVPIVKHKVIEIKCHSFQHLLSRALRLELLPRLTLLHGVLSLVDNS